MYTFINAIHAAYQKLSSKTVSRTTQRRLENAITTVASICDVLKPKDTIEIAIPALARRLEDVELAQSDLLWENLGNIGVTNDEEVFKSIINLIFNHSKTSGIVIIDNADSCCRTDAGQSPWTAV
jgi:hypothetical protein